VALAGCGLLLSRGHAKGVLAGILALPAIAAGLWFSVPHEIFERLATIPEQLQGGDLNQRLNIWSAGWGAFARAPLFGTGTGTFVSAAGLAPIDTAHNTALSILVGGGLCGLFLAMAVVVLAAHSVFETHGALRLGLATALLVWAITSLVATVEESRTTWLLFALIALAGRLAADAPEQLAACFPGPYTSHKPTAAAMPVL
jgi:O-antigen ligase